MPPKDRDPDPEAADEAAEGLTDEEQLWNEFDAEDGGALHDDAGDAGGRDDAEWDDADTEAEEASADESGEDQGDDTDTGSASEDDGDGTDGGEEPAIPTIEELQAQNERLRHSLESEKGRVAAGRRKIGELQRQISTAEQKPSRSKEDEDLLRKRREKLDAAKEEYGDVIGPLAEHIADLEGRLDKLSAQETRDLDAKRDELSELVRVERAALEEEHPDWLQTVAGNREEFNRWVDDQPRYLRDIAAQNTQEIVDGKATAYLVGMFKAHLHSGADGRDPATAERNRLERRREQQLAGARQVRGGSSRQTGTSGIPRRDDPDEQKHWNYFENLDRQREAR